MTRPDLRLALRGAVLGLGMLGRHHARLLQASFRVEFAGAVDPGGDRFGMVQNEALLFATVEELLAAAGVAVLVEKPLAATADETRAHEDLVLVTGRLASDVAFNVNVDWLSPTKVRRARILGEREMLVADTLTSDRAFFANNEVTSEWTAAQATRGVSEGDVTRFALSRREPLLVELEAFCDRLAGDDDAAVVTLEEGLATVLAAEAVLAAVASGETVRL